MATPPDNDAPMDHPDDDRTAEEVLRSMADSFAGFSSARDQLDAALETHHALILRTASQGPAVAREELGEKGFMAFTHLLALKLAYDAEAAAYRDWRARIQGMTPE